MTHSDKLEFTRVCIKTAEEAQRKLPTPTPKTDAVISAIPLLGSPIFAARDTYRRGLPAALVRDIRRGNMPESHLYPILGALLGGIIGSKIPAGERLNAMTSFLLGSRGAKVLPGFGGALVGSTVGGPLLGTSAANAQTAYKTAAEAQSKTSVPAALFPAIPGLASLIYAGKFMQDDNLEKMDRALKPEKTHKFLEAAARRNNIITPEGFFKLTKSPTGRPEGMLSQSLNGGNGVFISYKPHYMPNKYIGKAILADRLLDSPEHIKILDKARGHISGMGDITKMPAHILAHEIGHGMQKAKWTISTLARLGLKAPAIAAGVPVFSDNEQLGLASAGAGTAAALPGFYGELEASQIGKKLLERGYGAKEFKKLPFRVRNSSFAGVPTYAAVLTMPWLAYLGRKLSGGYDKKPTKKLFS